MRRRSPREPRAPRVNAGGGHVRRTSSGTLQHQPNRYGEHEEREHQNAALGEDSLDQSKPADHESLSFRAPHFVVPRCSVRRAAAARVSHAISTISPSRPFAMMSAHCEHSPWDLSDLRAPKMTGEVPCSTAWAYADAISAIRQRQRVMKRPRCSASGMC